ncbi:hypothetical protein Ahy_B01g053016 isoform D [Arachis hypogaea]|uniref:Uncharacterized protein n=1 Tax=Arachis hypogaea TaxID=3818 RepID=A0A445AQW9_ARAHY|nr:hypothetical protein Ahy_B01g053016 isoform D [Arachis hypogaea]
MFGFMIYYASLVELEEDIIAVYRWFLRREDDTGKHVESRKNIREKAFEELEKAFEELEIILYIMVFVNNRL